MPLRIALCCFLMALLAGCVTKGQGTKTSADYFSEGEEHYSNKDYEESIAKWKKVKELGSASPQLAAIIDLKVADAQFEMGNYIEAAATYESFRKFHPDNPGAPYALYKLAMCNYMQIQGIDRDQTPVNNSVNLFERFIKEYPNSGYVEDAKEKLAVCINKQAQYEVYIGRFYYRFGDYEAAIKRLEECVGKYPKMPATEEAYYYLEQAYKKTGDKERAKEAYNRLFIKFPTSKYLNKSESILDRFWQ